MCLIEASNHLTIDQQLYGIIAINCENVFTGFWRIDIAFKYPQIQILISRLIGMRINTVTFAVNHRFDRLTDLISGFLNPINELLILVWVSRAVPICVPSSGVIGSIGQARNIILLCRTLRQHWWIRRVRRFHTTIRFNIYLDCCTFVVNSTIHRNMNIVRC